MSEPLDLFGQDSLRADNTRKGMGYFGALDLTGGGIATEYSAGTEINGIPMEIPTLVPTLDDQELYEMINDIIPNEKKVPDHIFKKAWNHANLRLSQQMSPFASEEDTLINLWNKE